MVAFTIIFCSFQLGLLAQTDVSPFQSNARAWDEGLMRLSDNVNAPQLLDARVTPTLGTNTTVFNFSVEYVDIDGDIPVSINISLDGTAFNMNAVDELDLNVADGKNYTYTTFLPWGLHQYQIRCFDGLFQAETLPLAAPEVDPFPVYFDDNVTLFEDDFEGAEQFTQGGSGSMLWHLTNDTSAWSDPYHSATHAAWCGFETTGTYDNNMDVYLESPSINFANITAPCLEFYHWMDTASSTDTCRVFISTDNFTSSDLLFLNSGAISPWEKISIDIPGYVGSGDVRFRFLFHSDTSSTRRGWYVDDVKVFGKRGVELINPNNASSRFNGNISFSWDFTSIPAGAMNFTIQVSNSSSFATGVIENASIPETPRPISTVVFVNGSNGIYYWRVKAMYHGCSSNWSAIHWFNLVHNDHAPILNGSADPSIGDEDTTFNLDMTYTDSDGNVPTSVQILFDGGYYTMSKVNASDTNYMDGCLYRFTVSSLSLGVYPFQFAANDGRFLVNSDIANLSVREPNLVAPQLSSASMSPANGTSTTSFTFSVLYTDADGNLPESIFVTINSTSYPMGAVDPGDLDVADGKWYSWMGMLLWGNHTYRINCSDYRFTNATAIMPGPVLDPFYNLIYTPSLLTPANASSSFEGNIPFSWTSLNSALVGSLQYTWQISTSSTFGSIDLEVNGIGEGVGTTGTAILIDIGPGLHYWRVRPIAYGFAGSWSNASEITMISNDFAPTLTLAGVNPGVGDQFTSFNFSVTYTDLDNSTPTNVTVHINGTVQLMDKQDPLDLNYIDGCVYVYSTTFSHATTTFAYYFSCSDGMYNNATTITNGPSVTETNSNTPQLLDLLVSPGAGINSTVFNFSVTYVDDDNNLPTSITVTINETTYPMVADNLVDSNVMDGKGYYFVTRLSWGSYQFCVNCSDGVFDNATVWVSGLQINPFLTYPDFAILSLPGNLSNVACGDVTFSWFSQVLEPSLPTTFRWQLSNSSSFTSIIDEVSGITELLSAINISQVLVLPTGMYYWRVRPELYGFVGDWNSMNTFSLSWRPTLSSGSHSPESGNTSTSFTFIVTYIDLDNDAPSFINVVINGTEFAMVKQNATDTDFTDGVDYIFSSTFGPGGYSFLFQASDASFITATNLTVGPVVTNVAPALTSGLVTPGTGNTETTFNFSISYTDIDNNTPAYVRVCIDGIDINMAKQNIDDSNYTDGCTYEYLCKLPPIAHTYYFSTSDGFASNSTAVVAGPIVVNSAPTLASESVTPGSGTCLTTFTFSVTYIDAENNAPSYVRVYIDGTYFAMLKQNSSDIDYTDGCKYLFNSTLTLFPHLFYFAVSDGFEVVTSSTYPGPTMANLAPSLSAGMLSQATGNHYTIFIFSIIYTDADNLAPNFIRVYIDGTSHSMSKENSDDVNYADGCTYVWSTRLLTGTHDYYFYASDGLYAVSTILYQGLTVSSTNIAPPSLSSGALFPTSGNLYSIFTYRVIYTDADNNAPYYMRVYIDGTAYTMSKENESDNTYTDGCAYVYSRTLASGSHTYYFYAHDAFLATSTSSVSGPTVSSTNTSPSLDSGHISSPSGNGYTVFIYRVVYSDPENAAPSYVRVYIDGSYYAMSKEISSDINYTDGCSYIYSRTLAIGSHNYYFTASDGALTAGTTTTFEPIVSTANTAPTLSSPTISPINGTTTTMVMYTVVYMDAENDAPSYMYVYIDSSACTMSKQNTSDILYTDGCTYTLTFSFSAGTHTFYFSTYDGYQSFTTLTFTSPTIAMNSPSLTSGIVTPGSGNMYTVFNFSVIYTDAYNFMPSYVRVNISGALYTMIKQNSTDTVYSDGCLFYYATTFDPAIYTYFFTTNNGEANDTTSILSGPVVTNSLPALTSGSLTPVSGNYSTTFIYNVTYTDADNNPPSYIRVYINDTYYAMAKQNTSDATYTDGCIYLYSITNMAIGSYNCSFATYDGYATNITSTILGPTVLNMAAPMLVNPQVSPTMGINTTTFVFTVTYFDADNQFPSTINVTINGSTYVMVESVPADTNVADGKEYTYSRTLDWGIYHFRMNCSDGIFQNWTSWIDAPVSNPLYCISGSETRVAVLNEASQPTYFYGGNANNYATMISYIDSLGIAASAVTSSEIISGALANYDILILIDNAPSADCLSYIRTAWMNGLGVIAFDSSICAITYFGLLPAVSQGSNGANTYWDYSSTTSTAVLTSHYITQDYTVGQIISGTSGDSTWISSTMSSVSEYPQLTVLGTVSGNTARWPILVYEPVSYGKVIVIWDAVHAANTALRPLIKRSIEYCIPSKSGNLSLLTPLNGSVFPTGFINFTWSNISVPPYSVTYRWQLSTSATFSSILDEVGDIPNTSSPIFLTRNVTRASNAYYWRIRAESAPFSSNWSNPGYFYLQQAPSLSDGSLDPGTGNALTSFVYRVTYTHPDNIAPSYVRVNINGSSYSMSKVNSSDVTYTDGCTYFYICTLGTGTYSYYYSIYDGICLISTNIISGPFVSTINTAPILSSGMVLPSSGTTLTMFNYSVMYNDLDNNAPSYMYVYIDGSSHIMSKQVPADSNYTNGCTYVYYTTLAPTSHNYTFSTSDGFATNSTATFTGPTVTNEAPTLTSAFVFPSIGNTLTAFNYTVTYMDADNNAPSFMYVYIDGSSYSMSKQNSGDVTYTDGCVYVYSRTLTPTSHNYTFSTSDGFATNSTATFTGPAVTNEAPTLTSGSVSPSSGYPTTTFTYSVVYTDVDNNAPSYVYVYIDGYSYSMTKQVPADSNYTDGCAYTFSRTLAPISHNYSFSTSDSYVSNSTVTFTGPIVTNNPPTLTSSSVSPSSGNTYTAFDYTVTYTDADNNAPSYVRVYIDGVYFSMSKVNSADVTYTDGCVYTYKTLLQPVAHTMYFSTSDGYVTNSTSSINSPVVTNNTPTLTANSVTPTTGNSYTTFVFRITYTDADGTAPVYIYVVFNGNQYSMTKQNNNDLVYTDGCVYYYSLSSLSTGTYTYMFLASDGYQHVSTAGFSGPTVTSANSAPSLSSGSVSPTSGNIYYTTFIYRVTYTDANNDAPYYMRVYIDSSYSTMSKLNASDVTYTDGCVYIYSRTFSSTGSHNYYFYTSDGYTTTSTSTYTYPSVSSTNSGPSLSSGSVSPTSGNTYTTFVYRVTYTDANNDAPYYMRVYISGTYYSMSKEDASDITYTDGCVYIYSRTFSSTGTYNYYFYAYDGATTYTTSTYSYPIVSSTNTAPTLSAASISPPIGANTMAFNYYVTYTDAQNDAPYYMRVYIDGTYYSMSKENANDLTYTDGCVYRYSTTLSAGLHNYYFIAQDGSLSVTSSTSIGPLVLSNAPMLTTGTLTPSSGLPTTTFTYTVNYTDADNQAPSYIRVYIDGTYYSMSKQNTGDYLFTDGCIYTYSTTLALGSHNYYFSTSDGYTSNSTATYTGPTVTNNAPTLTSGSLSPGNGSPTTIFTYTITYTDADNQAPSYIRVYIDGSYYSMSKQNSGDNTYTDGCVYVYSRTLSVATHNYNFSTSDGYATNSTATFTGPTVTNNAPTLTSGSLSPGNGSPTTIFTYTITYTDADNQAPSYIRVYIDGSYYSMSKQNSGDNTYTDGCVYVYSRTLSVGTHDFYFSTSDGYATNTTTTNTGPTVTNNAPTLTSGSVSPAVGSTITMFTYTVTYTDADNNAPSYVYVYIDGSSYSMTKQDSGDYTYTDGCTYTYSRRLSSTGSHNYYFYTSDGYTTTSTSTMYSPTVTVNHAPSLTSSTVSPSTGVGNTLFTFSVTYTDSDNNAPSYVYVNIDGYEYPMYMQDSGDNTYTDGVVYVYSKKMAVGTYTYSFSCSDGSRSTSTSSKSLSVTRYSTTQVTTTTVLLLVFLIGVPLFIGIVATKAYNKKKGIKHATSTSVYRRPTPSFQPATSSPSPSSSYPSGSYPSSSYPSSSRPSGSGGSPPSGFGVNRAASRSDLRALPAPRTSPLPRTELVDRASTILKKRQVAIPSFDDSAYDPQASTYTAAFLARWKAPGEDIVPILDVITSGAAGAPTSMDIAEPVVNQVTPTPSGDHTSAHEYADQPDDGAATQMPPAVANTAPAEDTPQEVADIESQLMGIINPEASIEQHTDLPPGEDSSDGHVAGSRENPQLDTPMNTNVLTEAEALTEPASSIKPTEASGSIESVSSTETPTAEVPSATPAAEVPKENRDLARDGDADQQLLMDDPAESKDHPADSSAESHRKSIDEIDAQLMSLIKPKPDATGGSAEIDTSSLQNDSPSSESSPEDDDAPQAREDDAQDSKKPAKPIKE